LPLGKTHSKIHEVKQDDSLSIKHRLIDQGGDCLPLGIGIPLQSTVHQEQLLWERRNRSKHKNIARAVELYRLATRCGKS